MSAGRTRLVWIALAALVAFALAAIWLSYLNRSSPHSVFGGQPAIQLLNGIAIATVAAIITARQPRNAVGWLFFLIALGNISTNFAAMYAIRGVETAPGSLPAVRWIAWVGTFTWTFQMIGVTQLAFRFPDGRPLSRFWGRFAIAAMVVQLGFFAIFALFSFPTEGWRLDDHGEIDFNPPGAGLIAVSGAMLAAAGVALIAAVSIVLRLRRAEGEQRQQVKWFVFAGTWILVSAVVLMVLYATHAPLWLGNIFATAVNVTTGVLAVAAAIAIFRYRLYDIDVVISRTVLFGVMGAFITGVYIAVVVGIGTLVGAAGRASVGLSIAATVLVALAFQPVAERVQRFANRLVYGVRATPYEVMSDFADRMAGALSMTAALPEMAAAAAAGVGARAAEVRVHLRDGEEEVYVWPDGGDVGVASLRLPVRHGDIDVGGLAVTKSAGDPVTPAERTLLEDLAAQAGVVMENVRLARELEARLADIERQAEELAASRTRIMAAADAERRNLGRQIDEGISQQLLAIVDSLRGAAQKLSSSPTEAAAQLTALGEDANRTLEQLRDLARGIFPPLLVDQGLVPALRAQARKVGADLDLGAATEERYPAEVEAALYFCILEALRGLERAGVRAPVKVTIGADDGRVNFSLATAATEASLDPETALGMTDRVGALGGAFRAGRGGDDYVSGWVPTRVPEVAAAG